jgi:hypothetical protein
VFNDACIAMLHLIEKRKEGKGRVWPKCNQALLSGLGILETKPS